MNYRFSLPVVRQAPDGAAFFGPATGSRAAILAIALMGSGLAAPANAQVYWPNNGYGGYGGYGYYDRYDRGYYAGEEPLYEPAPPARRRPHHTKRSHRPKNSAPVKAAGKPQGPIVIAISIEQQHLKVYDVNGLFAEAPVSTGMRGHATPMGVFSVIQKNKWHRSNIYSGAPMPYMQRITWSGIALHAGALPGYPASHGCIRMPTNFAMRMWGWTRMGARVVITPGDVTPVDFSHPSLMTRKPSPVAVVPEVTPKPAPAPIADKAEIFKISDSAAAPIKFETLELRLNSIADKNDATRIANAGRETVGVATPENKSRNETPAPIAEQPLKSETAQPDQPGNDATAPVVKRTGHIAAFISRKTGRLYVRQNFEPLFDVPVTITGDGPLGTHLFTMRADKENAGAYRWSVVSLPVPVHNDKRSRRKKPIEVSAPQPAPSSPAEALDRITIPDDAMQRIAEAIAPGGSLIVSDQGLGNETGRGTDFIVPLR